jgi:hypothetical protein
MNFVPKLIVVLLVLFLFASCATVVTFDVEHPPLVDLHGVNTITVIPLEWTGVRGQEYLASCVTAALMDGLRRGNIDIVDPYALEYSGGRNYSQYADVYITGRIINVNTYEQVETKSEIYSTHTIIREFITGTAVVDIEYRYIRSADNKTLGNFKKREMATASFERTRYRDQNVNQNTGRNANRNTPRDTNRNTDRRRAEQPRSAFPQRGTWQESTSASAIAYFSDTMYHELGPWTTAESRKIKSRTGDNALAAEAKSLVEQNRYDEAIVLYKTIYEQNGNVFAGYNAAIVLAANEQFSSALALLERLRDGMLKEGKTVPAFIRNEIKRITEIINESRVLGAYTSIETKTVSPASTAATAAAAAAAGRAIAGTVNLNPAMVYALNGSIASVDDNSIFTKMVAYADAVNGRWSIRLPDPAPAIVWLLVTDGRREYFITKTAIIISDKIPGSASGSIALNTAEMIKLTN